MGLIVEDGTIVAGANSYASVATLRDYVGTVALPADVLDADLERALVKATRYIDGKYEGRWIGTRVQPITQRLAWPQYGVTLVRYPYGTASRHKGYALSNFPYNQIPPEIKDACCELALRALTAPLAADIAPTSRVVKKKVDVLETTYADTGDYAVTYQVVDQLLKRYLKDNEVQRG